MLADFRVDRRLGAGGMGEVWLATDLALDRQVAIKVLPPSVALDGSRRERLLREARAQARIQHANVCHIYYVGEERGLVFFAMEYIVGDSLTERLGRGPVSAADAIEMIRMAALGLREAQRHGFTHRDIKPSNLMVDGHGQIKVVDFGLVTRGEFDPTGVVDGAVAVTQTALVGTPLYMAPEQGRGEVVDFRADIYALGATLHHLVAGRPPFEGDSAAVLRTLHSDGARPTLTATRGGRKLLPLDEVLTRMMAKRPEDRYDSYDALIADLERISTAHTRPAGIIVRGCAALVDLLAALLLSLPLHLLAAGKHDTDASFVLVWPLYVALTLSRWSSTFGQILFDLEVISIDTGRRPTFLQALRRWALEYGLLALGILGSNVAPRSWVHDGANVLCGIAVVVAITLGLYALRRPDKRAFWDRAARTLVRYRRPRT